MQPIDFFITEFENVCAVAAGFELSPRMVADLKSATWQHAVNGTLKIYHLGKKLQ